MGNCLKRGSAKEWGGEEWDFPVKEDEKGSLGNFETSTPAVEVKIKITKKQLEELLGRAQGKGLSVQQVLTRLINVSDRFETHQRSWRPALQSIPE
ncbi:DUF4228 domain protein [Quillaja saponaria]|uniref:DUF4228 domain protein n=1 Tax=Quillaja saponaria TaxID=32244 RepID=A0AAD7PR56_QUISA|nr:DUF4228 domain protein [Quillaja saponaria]